ncbi:MAG: hypothetical protein GXP13_00435 [Gammaproteobacteria bacterium]|nr:hypothetical protein [Gammaproteobacteria bacterium]
MVDGAAYDHADVKEKGLTQKRKGAEDAKINIVYFQEAVLYLYVKVIEFQVDV